MITGRDVITTTITAAGCTHTLLSFSQLRKETAFKEMISPLEQRRAKYMKRKSEFGDRSDEVWISPS